MKEDFNNGQRWFVWVDYQEDEKNLEIWLSDKPARPGKSLVTYQADLNMLWKTERGYIGFTAVTGSYESSYNLYNWSFINNPPVSETSPDLISNIISVEENTHVNTFVANFGKEATKESYITSLYNGAPGRGGKVLSSYQTPVTKPGEGLYSSFPLPPLSELKKDIYVIADSTNRVPECNEENNISKAAVVWIKATDNYGGSDRQIFIITVGSEKAKESVSLSTQEDVEINYNINSHSNNDEIISQPENGIVTLSDGIFSYKPNRDFNGEDHFTIKTDHVIDISINVEPVNDAPLAHNLT